MFAAHLLRAGRGHAKHEGPRQSRGLSSGVAINEEAAKERVRDMVPEEVRLQATFVEVVARAAFRSSGPADLDGGSMMVTVSVLLASEP